jgi:acetylornithine/succinyldiaminopimelate/putrescine aminotransferase
MATASAAAEPCSRPALLSLETAHRLDVADVAAMFKQYVNPGQYHFLELLGFHEILLEKAEGIHYVDRQGRRILDFFGGFGSVAFGHNHPRLVAARRAYEEAHRQQIAMAFMSPYACTLARNLATIAPGDLDMVFLASTGSEAVEYALKLAEAVQGPDRRRVGYAANAFHGKSRGALSVTDSTFYRGPFTLLDNTVRFPFGDPAALENSLASDPQIGAVILETIQGGGGIVPAPAGYWQQVREICDRHGVLWIADEVQCGYGRTGCFFAFEHAGVVPDIVCLAKSLGGGMAALGATISRRPLFMRAYGKPKTALVHAPATFGGIGNSCAVAIEALNLLYDDALIDNAATQGAYLLDRLAALQRKYPSMIKDVRGQGLMVGVEFHDISRTLPPGVRQAVSVLDDKLKGSLCGFVGSLLLREYAVLVAFTEYNRNVVRLEPPLIIGRPDVDRFVDALDDLLGRGVVRIVSDYARYAVKQRVGG